MVADKGKKAKVAEGEGDEETENIDSELVLSIEKLQEIQDELEKVANLSLSLISLLFEIDFGNRKKTTFLTSRT